MTAVATAPLVTSTWVGVCAVSDICLGQGVAAFVCGQQIAIFRTDDDQLFALGNRDPHTQANVLSRGILGSRQDRPVVISPMLKHAFDLQSGVSLSDPEIAVPSYPIRVVGERIEVMCPDG